MEAHQANRVILMTEYRERFYRERVKAPGLTSFQISVGETDLWVSADRRLDREALDSVFQYRHQVENYIKGHEAFLKTLLPYPGDPFAPPIIREMIAAARAAGVGPMASVAGAIAQFVGRDLLKWSEKVIVENGGDIFLSVNRAVTVSVFAGESVLSEKIGIRIPENQMPVGVCASSGTVGHSFSLGRADAVCIIAPSAALADAAATALCNGVKTKKDIKEVPARADRITGLAGGLAILEDTMATWGDIELVGL
ncbi:MAG: UPF0280 family protein [Pseudomonadota bacterium]